MKILWGLIDIPEKHYHTFDPKKWEVLSITKVTTVDLWGTKEPGGEITTYTNNCLGCGDLISRVIDQRPSEPETFYERLLNRKI